MPDETPEPEVRSSARENAEHFAHSTHGDPLNTDQAIALAHVYAILALTDAVAANRSGLVIPPLTSPGQYPPFHEPQPRPWTSGLLPPHRSAEHKGLRPDNIIRREPSLDEVAEGITASAIDKLRNREDFIPTTVTQEISEIAEAAANRIATTPRDAFPPNDDHITED